MFNYIRNNVILILRTFLKEVIINVDKDLCIKIVITVLLTLMRHSKNLKINNKDLIKLI